MEVTFSMENVWIKHTLSTITVSLKTLFDKNSVGQNIKRKEKKSTVNCKSFGVLRKCCIIKTLPGKLSRTKPEQRKKSTTTPPDFSHWKKLVSSYPYLVRQCLQCRHLFKNCIKQFWWNVLHVITSKQYHLHTLSLVDCSQHNGLMQLY